MQHPQDPPTRPVCPRCGSGRTEGHGSFTYKDGTRQRRWLCRSCGRTFSLTTDTPLHYLKKRTEWVRMSEAIGQRLSVRKAAVHLGVRVSTAFRWRHRLLKELAGKPQPILTGCTAAGEAYVPYSEKGLRRRIVDTQALPGGANSRPKRFRRFIDGRPSCVLLACAGDERVAVITGQGRPKPDQLQSCLASVLGSVTELWGVGLAPYGESCRRLGVPHREAAGQLWSHPSQVVDRLRGQFYSWLRRFFGVATRYLPNYVAWFRFVCSPGCTESAGETGLRLLREARALVEPVSAA